jgi:hypothetical protein
VVSKVKLIQSLEGATTMMASEELKPRIRELVEELWAEHRAAKTGAGKEVPDADSGLIEDAGCGCQACISAGQMLYEAGG